MHRPLLLALLVLGLLAPAAHAAGEEYALVHGCYALKAKAGGAIVGKEGAAYRTGAAAEAFRMQATDLGKYLFYGRAKDFMAAGGDGVTVAGDASEAADWRVESAGGAFRISRPDTGRLLAVGDGGKLVLVDAAGAGDNALFTFEQADGCPAFPEIELNADGTPFQGPTPFGETTGTVDAHMHQMAFEFLGGKAHCGRPWHPYGVTKALVDCPDHYTNVSPLETALGGGETHDPVGWPTFRYWPNPVSLTHENSYYRWLERAWMGGLRVFVNLLVDNAALCKVYPLKSDRPNVCNEMNTVRLEAQRMREMQDYIDAQAGGPGKGFYRIVTSPFEAREVINQGKLAIVMGIEISELFDCNLTNDQPVPGCTRESIDRQLDEVHKLGVRDMELLNKFDNAFAGVAGDNGQTGVVVNSGNKLETGRFWQMQKCDGEDHDHTQLSASSNHNTDQLIANGLQAFVPAGTAPIYQSGPHCNQRGLSGLGEYLIRRMIEKKMMIDPDHLSVLARRQALALLEAERYSGVVSSHSWSTYDAYPRIYRLGGFITPYAGSSTTFVEEWKKMKKVRDPRFHWGFGYGADMNGFGSQGRPRGKDVKNPVTYPFRSFDGSVTFTKQRSGEREYDINADGVSHYGLYPDWIEDLRKLAGDEIVDDMAQGAEAYLQMWERAEGVPARRCLPARTRFSAKGLGKLRLGAGVVEALRAAGQPVRRPGRVWTYCVQGPRDGRQAGQVKSVLTPQGAVDLVVSTGPEHAARRTAARAKASRLKGTKAFGRGLRVRSAGGGRRYVYGVRNKRVRFVALASKSAARTPATLRANLKLAGF